MASVVRPLFTRFFGRTIGEAAAFALGAAASPALRPPVYELEAAVNAAYPNRRLDPETAAAIVAEDVERRDWGVSESASSGVDQDRFDALYGEALNAPGLETLYSLWRRGLIDADGFRHGLRKAKLEGRWDGSLEGAKEVLLSASDLAMARQQGFVDDARQLAESEKQGVSAGNATILYELAGLPPGAAEAQSLLNRGLIDDALFAQIVREGHTKTKYTDLLRRAAVYVLSPINYVEGRLRGWLTDPQMYAGTALSGMTQADTDLLFKIHGRPISFHQTFIGTRRGGTLDGPTAGIDDAFLASLRRSNIQPPFYNLAWAQRYVYPSPFVLRALTQSGDITRAEAEQVLLFQGWEPTFAAKVAAAWGGGVGSAGKELTKGELVDEYEGGFITEAELRDHLTALGYTGPALDLEIHLADARRIKGWRDKGITALGKRYIDSTMDSAAADGYLQELGVVVADTRARIIRVWDIEREFK